MAYNLFYHHEVVKDLEKISRNFKDLIRKSIENKLLNDPIHFGLPLRKTFKGYLKLRVGDYRVIFKIVNKDIVVLKIGHRKNIYDKDLKREYKIGKE